MGGVVNLVDLVSTNKRLPKWRVKKEVMSGGVEKVEKPSYAMALKKELSPASAGEIRIVENVIVDKQSSVKRDKIKPAAPVAKKAVTMKTKADPMIKDAKKTMTAVGAPESELSFLDLAGIDPQEQKEVNTLLIMKAEPGPLTINAINAMINKANPNGIKAAVVDKSVSNTDKRALVEMNVKTGGPVAKTTRPKMVKGAPVGVELHRLLMNQDDLNKHMQGLRYKAENAPGAKFEMNHATSVNGDSWAYALRAKQASAPYNGCQIDHGAWLEDESPTKTLEEQATDLQRVSLPVAKDQVNDPPKNAVIVEMSDKRECRSIWNIGNKHNVPVEEEAAAEIECVSAKPSKVKIVKHTKKAQRRYKGVFDGKRKTSKKPAASKMCRGEGGTEVSIYLCVCKCMCEGLFGKFRWTGCKFVNVMDPEPSI